MAGEAVPVFLLPRSALVAARLLIAGYGQAEAVLDTGSTYSSVSPLVADRLGLVGQGAVRTVRRTTEAGGREPEPLYALSSVSLGDTTLAGLEVFVSRWPPLLGVDGILGLNFFRRFHRLLFDVDRMLLTLE